MRCECDWQLTDTGYTQHYHYYGNCLVHTPRIIKGIPKTPGWYPNRDLTVWNDGTVTKEQ